MEKTQEKFFHRASVGADNVLAAAMRTDHSRGGHSSNSYYGSGPEKQFTAND